MCTCQARYIPLRNLRAERLKEERLCPLSWLAAEYDLLPRWLHQRIAPLRRLVYNRHTHAAFKKRCVGHRERNTKRLMMIRGLTAGTCSIDMILREFEGKYV